MDEQPVDNNDTVLSPRARRMLVRYGINPDDAEAISKIPSNVLLWLPDFGPKTMREVDSFVQARGYRTTFDHDIGVGLGCEGAMRYLGLVADDSLEKRVAEAPGTKKQKIFRLLRGQKTRYLGASRVAELVGCTPGYVCVVKNEFYAKNLHL